MGMESHEGPRRRRIGGDKRAQQTVRLSGTARTLVERLRQPGIVFEDGCSLGDIIEMAIIDFAREPEASEA